MPRKPPSFTSDLYKLARTSNNLRAAAKGPIPYSKRVVRRKVYRRTNAGLDGILRALGLSGKRRR